MMRIIYNSEIVKPVYLRVLIIEDEVASSNTVVVKPPVRVFRGLRLTDPTFNFLSWTKGYQAFQVSMLLAFGLIHFFSKC